MVDLQGLIISLIDLFGGLVIAIRLYRRLNHRVAIGLGGSLMLMGLVTRFVAFALLGGITLWIVGGSGLAAFATFFVMAVRQMASK